MELTQAFLDYITNTVVDLQNDKKKLIEANERLAKDLVALIGKEDLIEEENTALIRKNALLEGELELLKSQLLEATKTLDEEFDMPDWKDIKKGMDNPIDIEGIVRSHFALSTNTYEAKIEEQYVKAIDEALKESEPV